MDHLKRMYMQEHSVSKETNCDVKHFISYGDERFSESLARMKRQARQLGLFDKVIAYTPDDLPMCIKGSPLFTYTRGGGYWLWKPSLFTRRCRAAPLVMWFIMLTLVAGSTAIARSGANTGN